jgi:hypothetical protein
MRVFIFQQYYTQRDNARASGSSLHCALTRGAGFDSWYALLSHDEPQSTATSIITQHFYLQMQETEDVDAFIYRLHLLFATLSNLSVNTAGVGKHAVLLQALHADRYRDCKRTSHALVLL